MTRLRTPIEIQGTFAKPAFGVDAGKLAKQGGMAAALGAVLTPLGAAKARGVPVPMRTAQRGDAAAGSGG